MKNQLKSLHLMQRLIERLNAENVEISYTLLAHYFLVHFSDIESLTVNQVCHENFLFRSTLDRFCKSIGYENFRELKEAKQEAAFYHTDYDFDFLSEIANLSSHMNQYAPEIQTFINILDMHEYIFFLMPYHLYSPFYSFQKEMMYHQKLVHLMPNIDRHFALTKSYMDQSLMVVLDFNPFFTFSVQEYLEKIDCYKYRICYDDISTNIQWNQTLKLEKQAKSLMERYQISLLLDLIVKKYQEAHER